jgi:hypothetical protein
MARGDRVSVQVQLAVDLDESHRAGVASEDRDGGRAQMLALEGLGVGCDRRDGRRTAAVRHAEPVHDVLGFDTGPHDDAHLGELGAHVGEPHGERLLRVVELGSPLEQCGALGVEVGELPRTVWNSPIARWISNGWHTSSQSSVRFDRGKLRCDVRADVKASGQVRQLHDYRSANPC